jgi:hypothetical protein
MLSTVFTANRWGHGCCSGDGKSVGANPCGRLGGGERNEIQTKMNRGKNSEMPLIIAQITNRIWQIGFWNFFKNLVSVRTFRTQVEGALTPVDGDCQYVLFNVTVPPQLVMESVKITPMLFQQLF